MSFPNDMPEPVFEGQEIVWVREYPVETNFSKGPVECDVIEKKIKRIEFKYRAYRICEGGKLRWELMSTK